MFRPERLALSLLASVPATGLAATGLLLCGWFSAQLALILGIGTALLLARPLWRHAESNSPWTSRSAAALAAVLLLAFLLRWPPALHVQGGQDQGVYMSMAAHFVETGDLYIEDAVRDQLRTPEAIGRYDSNNRSGVYEPGIYTDAQRDHYFSRFYHLHPLWIGIFGGIAGMQHSAVSQLFFAMLSLLFIGMLVARTSGWHAGVAGVVMFAILPLHVFFSKFPISEMPTLASSLMGFYAMVRYHESTKDGPQPVWLVLSALAFFSLFLMRISGFLYVPIFLLGALMSHAFVDNPRVRLHWHLFWSGSIVCYGLSVIYGLIWSPPYAREIYATGLGRPLYDSAIFWLPCLVVLALLFFFMTRNESTRERLLRPVLSSTQGLLERGAPLILLALVAYGIVKTGLLAFTDHYRAHPWYDIRWQSSHAGWLAVARSTLVVSVEHLTPLVALLVPFALWRPGRSAERTLLMAMCLMVAAYVVAVQWFTPYQYYYARYLLSELVPFMLLLVILRCVDWWKIQRLRPWLVLGGLITAGYCAWFTLPLVGFKEADGAEASISRIASRLDDTDVLLIDAKNISLYQRLSTPLRLWFGKRVYILENRNQLLEIIRDLKRARFSDIYLLGGTPSTLPDFELVDHITYGQRVMAYKPFVPRSVQVESLDMAFYRLNESAWAGNALISASGVSPAELGTNCSTGFHADGIWTDGKATIHSVLLPHGHWRSFSLKVGGSRPDYDRAQVEVLIDGRKLRQAGVHGNEIHFEIDALDESTIADIEIRSTTFVPSKLGIGVDNRHLGLDIQALKLQ